MVSIVLPNTGDANWGPILNTAVNAINTGKPDLANIEVNVKNYGAIGNGITDDTLAIQTAINTAGEGGSVFIPSGTYKISAQLVVFSKFQMRGAGTGATQINQVTNNTPIIVSRSYVSALSYTPVGNLTIKDIRLNGTSTGSGQHGIILRDFYSRVENVYVTATGGNGVRFTHLNDASSPFGSSMPENQLLGTTVRNCGNTGVYAVHLGADDNAKLTAGIVQNLIVDTTGSATAPDSHLSVGASANWVVRGVHGYGTVGSDSVRINAASSTIVDDVFVDGAFGSSSAGVNFRNLQQSTIVNNVTVNAPNSSTTNGAIFLQRSGSFTAPRITVSNLTVVQVNNKTIAGVNSADAAIVARLSGFVTDGAFAGNVTAVGGTGSGNIKTTNSSGLNSGTLATVANTVTEGDVASFVIPANDAVAGSQYRCTVRMTASTTGTPNLSLRIRIGTNSVAIPRSVVATASALASAAGEIEFFLTVLTGGASGTISCYARSVSRFTNGAGGAANVESDVTQTVPTTDCTANQTVHVQATWGTASASNTITGTNIIVSRLGSL